MFKSIRTVDEYYKEMEVLMRETAEATMSRFLSGLNREIADHAEMFPYNTLHNLVHQVTKVEQQQQHGGRARTIRNRPAVPTWRRPQGATGGGALLGRPRPPLPHLLAAHQLHRRLHQPPALVIGALFFRHQLWHLLAAATSSASSAKERGTLLLSAPVGGPC